MISATSHLEFSKLKQRYLLLRLAEILFLVGGTILLTYALASLLVPASFAKQLLSSLAGVVVFLVRANHYKLHKLNDNMFARYLNTRYPPLKESADLLIRNERELTPLQQLQKIQTRQQFDSIYPTIQLPHHLLQAVGIFVGCLLAYFVLTAFSVTPKRTLTGETPNTVQEIKPATGDTLATFIKSLTININPPRYTLLNPSRSTHPHISVPDGSMVTWLAIFTSEVKNVKIIISGRDSTELKYTSNNTYSIQKTIASSGFYQIQWTALRATYRSDYYKIEVTEDQAPKVEISNLLQFTKLRLTDNLNVEVNSLLRDDYGMVDAVIIATVSKGSGESVKFREEKLRFTVQEKSQAKRSTHRSHSTC